MVEPRPSESDAQALRPLRSRDALAAVLVLVALVSAVLWSYLTTTAVDATAASFARADLPGELTTDLHPGTWNVYAERAAEIRSITVSSDGRSIDVDTDDPPGTTYGRAGSESQVIGSFAIPVGGMATGVRITVDGWAQDPDSTFAVGAADAFDYTTAQRWGVVALLVVNITAAALVVLVPILRQRRRRHAAAEPA